MRKILAVGAIALVAMSTDVYAEVVTLRCSFLPAPNGDQGPGDATMDIDLDNRTVSWGGMTDPANVGDRYVYFGSGSAMRIDRRTLVLSGRSTQGGYGDVAECRRVKKEGF